MIFCRPSSIYSSQEFDLKRLSSHLAANSAATNFIESAVRLIVNIVIGVVPVAKITLCISGCVVGWPKEGS